MNIALKTTGSATSATSKLEKIHPVFLSFIDVYFERANKLA